jgi:hypothetical protein
MGLCDKYRDVDLLAQIEAVQDGVVLKKQSSILIPQKIFLNKNSVNLSLSVLCTANQRALTG